MPQQYKVRYIYDPESEKTCLDGPWRTVLAGDDETGEDIRIVHVSDSSPEESEEHAAYLSRERMATSTTNNINHHIRKPEIWWRIALG